MKRRGSYVFGVLLFLSIAPVPAAVAQSGFGRAVAVGGSEILVGEAANQATSGVVYVYRRNEGEWRETAQLVSSETAARDRFGRAIALDGRTLLVAGTMQEGESGVVFVFEKTGAGNWTEVGKLMAAEADQTFGGAVAVSGNAALVGAPGQNTVHVFIRGADGQWRPRGSLTVSDGAEGERFGGAVAIDGNRALIGAPAGAGVGGRGPGARGDAAGGATGAVYAFERDAAGNWNQQAKLTPIGLPPRTGYGRTLALDGSDAFIGAPATNGSVGTVFAFTYDPGSREWIEDSPLSPFDGHVRSQFGSSIAFTGPEVWVGAPGAGGAGRVYRFRRDMSSGDWMGSIKLASRQVEGRDQFSGTLAVGDGVAVAGAPGDDFGAGTAIVFEQDAGGATWSEQAKIFSEIKNIEAALGSQIDCTEGSAHAFDCNEVDLVAFLPTHTIGGERGVRTNDVWGWTDAMTGKEYALVGMSNTATFVDISDPLNPIYLGKLPLHEGAQPSTWRDIKVYNDHTFIVSDGAGDHGMQVFDLTQLRDVRSPPVIFEETAHYDGIASAHNIVINEETGYAYSVGSSGGGETCGGGLHMINIEDPTNPQFAGCFADQATGRRNTGYSHDAQCVTYHGPDREHQGKEICLGSNETAISIADVTDKANPVALSSASYPNVGYSHQGWLSEDQRYFYMNDELDEIAGDIVGTRTLIWDITDLDDPILAREYLSENTATDHNLYIRGDYMYQSNYRSGFRVFNIADPENPVPVGFLDTVPYGEDGPGMGGSWSNYPFFESGLIIVTSRDEGLFLVRRRRPET